MKAFVTVGNSSCHIMAHILASNSFLNTLRVIIKVESSLFESKSESYIYIYIFIKSKYLYIAQEFEVFYVF